MNDDLFDTPGNNNQFVLSYELVFLLQWLMDHDSHKLKKIISNALSSGLKNELQKNDILDETGDLAEIQESLIEFFGMLESLLLESMHEHAVKRALEKNLLPSIEQIDSTVCDDATVRFSVEKATSNIDNHPEKNPKELLFKELLKRWKPNKKTILN